MPGLCLVCWAKRAAAGDNRGLCNGWGFNAMTWPRASKRIAFRKARLRAHPPAGRCPAALAACARLTIEPDLT